MAKPTTVIKRDGTEVPYDENKILEAIRKAFFRCGFNFVPESVRTYALFLVENLKSNHVEDIQDAVQTAIMANNYYTVAAEYIKYREKHKEVRFVEERLKYMEKYSVSKVNAASSSETDDNSNVSQKNVANLEGEVYKTTNRIIQRRRMKKKLLEMFPEVADMYEKDLDNHIIYVHDEASSPTLKPYCMACSLYPLLEEGSGNVDGITPTPPNDIQSFSGQVTNLVFLLSSQVKGAVALGEYIIALNYYVVMEFGEDWYMKLDDSYTSGVALHRRSVRDVILKGMKQFIYGVNQPAGNRSYNSPFTNISYYDEVYFNALFGNFKYPDGTKPEWHQIDVLQKMFCKLHRELRMIKPLTFPVTTFCMVHDGEKCIDESFKKWSCEEYAKGTSAFTFLSDSPTSLASCCFSKDTKFMWKSSTSGVHITTFEEFMSLQYNNQKENLKIFHNGSWVPGKVIVLPNREMFKVTTYNNKEYILTDNHINVTYDGEKQTSELTTDDYLMFNTQILYQTPEVDEHLTYEQGFVVGSFIGDGSLGATIKNTIYQLEISQNKNKYKKTIDIFNIANKQLGGENTCTLKGIVNNKYPVSLISKELIQFIIKWTNWNRGTKSNTKELNMNCLLQSVEFRKGILDGWYHTDGGNSNGCYTTSKKLVECMEALITSLGMNSIINCSDRTDEKVSIRNNTYNRNYPLYCIRWYEQTNHRLCKNGDTSWKRKNNSIYFRIKSIERVEYSDNVYCVECKNDEPYFTLPSGLITHNCRVLNKLTFSSTTGGLGIMTGSCNVVTLNLNRILQDYFINFIPSEPPGNMQSRLENSRKYFRENYSEFYANFCKYLSSILERVYKYQIAYKTMLYEQEDAGMYSSSNAGYIRLSKLYCTIGVIGYFEAAKFLGIETSYNDVYIKFLQKIFDTIREENEKHSISTGSKPFVFNTEAVPGESLAVKLYNWDKSDGYVVPSDQNLYNCYFFSPWDDTDILTKMKLHGKDVAPYLGGGQAAHLNLCSHLSAEQYSKLVDDAIRFGTNYYTYNIPVTECAECGHVVNAPVEECPKCHSKKLKYWTRIIGYMTCVNNWSTERAKEFHKRFFGDKTI